jgi:serine/threonine protein kinase
LAYLAPEVITKSNNTNGEKVDVWCLGICLFILLCGYYPFSDNNNEREHLVNILQGNYTIPTYLSHNCRNLIKSMLIRNPDKRISLDEIKKHPWII